MTRDPELDRRIADVLAKLATLSEVPAATLEATHSKSSESPLPAGVSMRATAADRPPPKDRSRYDYWRWHFAQCHTDHARRTVLYLAETDYNAAVQRSPALDVRRDTGEARDVRLIEWYEGATPEEAALLESAHGRHVTPAHIRKLRRVFRRDPERGERLQGWAGWSDEDRLKAINRLRNDGLGVRRIASELGTSHNSVMRYLGGHRRRLAWTSSDKR